MSARVRLMKNSDVPRLTAADPALIERLEVLYRRPGLMIRRCHQFAVSIFLRECAAFGLTTSQFGVLYIASCCPGVTQIGLSGLIGLDRSTTNAVARRLMRNGHLARRPHPRDARKQCLHVTPAGERLLAAIQGVARRAADAFLAPLATRERKAFLACLAKLVDHHNAEARAPLIVPRRPHGAPTRRVDHHPASGAHT